MHQCIRASPLIGASNSPESLRLLPLISRSPSAQAATRALPARGLTVFIFFALILSPPARASLVDPVLYVDPLLAAACNSYDPFLRACLTGTNTAFPTLAGAAAAATPGTTVLIRDGAYNEQLVPQKSGRPGAPIIFKAFDSESVSIAPPLGYPAVDLSGRSYIIIDGIHAENCFWLEADNANSNVVQNCVFEHTPATGTTGNVRFVLSDYNRVLNNIMEDGNDNLCFIESDHNLAASNTIILARHSIFGIRCGNSNVVCGNYFSNPAQHIGEVYDCGVDTDPVPHSYDSTKHNVIEWNVFDVTTNHYSVSGGNGLQYAGQQGIIRRNFFMECNVGLGMQVYSDEALFNTSNRVYNNVFYTNIGPGLSLFAATTNNIYVNNIFFGNQGCINDCNVTTPGQIVYRPTFAGNVLLRRNDLLFQTPGQPVFEKEFGAGYTLAQFTNIFPGVAFETSEEDPLFVEAPGFNFLLQSNSPMIDAGAFLTTTTTEGSGTNLPVADAAWFRDSFGIDGLRGDLIQLQGQSQPARIIAIDYPDNILALDRSLTWTAGQGVAPAFNGAAPDLGAYEYSPVRSLSIALSPGEVRLSWPSNVAGCQLEFTTNLDSSSPVTWLPVPFPVLLTNTWEVAVPLAQSPMFFRLAK